MVDTPSDSKIAVVKVGSTSLTTHENRLDTQLIASLASQISSARSDGWRVTVVSSGAVAAGAGMLGIDKIPTASLERQALSAIGQPSLMNAWSKSFATYGVPVAQTLLTPDVLGSDSNFKQVIEVGWRYGAVTIVNENDAVTNRELLGLDGSEAPNNPLAIRDNDDLASRLAQTLQAQIVLLLTDVPGICTSDPNLTPLDDLEVIRELHGPDDPSLAGLGAGSILGRGGPASKVHAAIEIRNAGITAVIAGSRTDSVIEKILSGSQDLGTWVRPLA